MRQQVVIIRADIKELAALETVSEKLEEKYMRSAYARESSGEAILSMHLDPEGEYIETKEVLSFVKKISPTSCKVIDYLNLEYEAEFTECRLDRKSTRLNSSHH